MANKFSRRKRLGLQMKRIILKINYIYAKELKNTNIYNSDCNILIKNLSLYVPGSEKVYKTIKSRKKEPHNCPFNNSRGKYKTHKLGE